MTLVNAAAMWSGTVFAHQMQKYLISNIQSIKAETATAEMKPIN